MEIRLIKTQRVLSPTQISLADYVINPYRGCEFGCYYCYSQTNKNIQRDGFNDNLYIKVNAPQILEKELLTIHPKRVLLGSTTECFTYQEEKHGITRDILNILNQRNIPYTILTKSPLIINAISQISQNKDNKVYFTLNTHNEQLARALEPNAPPLKTRLTAITRLTAAKINTRVHIGPFIPFVSDLDKILRLIPQGTKEVDVELYNKKQGNFETIIKNLRHLLNEKQLNSLREAYASKEKYDAYAAKLKEYIKTLKTRFTFFYIVSGFDNYYDQTIDYEKPLV